MAKQGPGGIQESPKLYTGISERDYCEAMKYIKGNWRMRTVCRHLEIPERKLKAMMTDRGDVVPVKYC